jgi:hypothetical protein
MRECRVRLCQRLFDLVGRPTYQLIRSYTLALFAVFAIGFIPTQAMVHPVTEDYEKTDNFIEHLDAILAYLGTKIRNTKVPCEYTKELATYLKGVNENYKKSASNSLQVVSTGSLPFPSKEMETHFPLLNKSIHALVEKASEIGKSPQVSRIGFSLMHGCCACLNPTTLQPELMLSLNRRGEFASPYNSDAEIKAIIAHELGHIALGHLDLKKQLLSCAPLLNRLTLCSGAGLLIWALLTPPYTLLDLQILYWVTVNPGIIFALGKALLYLCYRIINPELEYEADSFGARMTSYDDMIKALINMQYWRNHLRILKLRLSEPEMKKYGRMIFQSKESAYTNRIVALQEEKRTNQRRNNLCARITTKAVVLFTTLGAALFKFIGWPLPAS